MPPDKGAKLLFCALVPYGRPVVARPTHRKPNEPDGTAERCPPQHDVRCLARDAILSRKLTAQQNERITRRNSTTQFGVGVCSRARSLGWSFGGLRGEFRCNVHSRATNFEVAFRCVTRGVLREVFARERHICGGIGCLWGEFGAETPLSERKIVNFKKITKTYRNYAQNMI